MRLRSLACLPLLVVCFNATARDLYTEINRLRAGAGDCVAVNQLSPLKLRGALERVARDLPRGNKLQHGLAAVGYRAARSSVLWIKGDGGGAQAVAMLAKPGYCEKLQDAAVSEICIYRNARQIWIVLAAPFAPTVGQSEEAAGQRVPELVNQARATPRSCGKALFKAVRPVRFLP